MPYISPNENLQYGVTALTSQTCSISAPTDKAYVLPAKPGETSLHEARLVNREWVLGNINEHGQWLPLTSRAHFHSKFFNFTNEKELDEDGESHVGKSASIVLLPIASTVPDGVIFRINPENLFETHRKEVDLRGKGKVFFDDRVYIQQKKTFGNLVVEIISEASNPAIDAAVNAFSAFTQRFPYRTHEMAKKGSINLVLILNKTEKFTETPFPGASGWHDEALLSVFQISEDGQNIQFHSLHEIGGLFRIIGNKYAHGLTWGIAFDQAEALAENVEKRRTREEIILNRLLISIEKTAKQNGCEDFSHNIEFYIDVDDPYFQNGFLMYAHGSGVIWKWINTALTEQGQPNIYDLINDIHRQGLDGLEGNDLDKLIAAYKRINPTNYPIFVELVNHYFRKSDLCTLKNEALKRKSDSQLNKLF